MLGKRTGKSAKRSGHSSRKGGTGPHKVLLTGAFGNIGRHVLRELLRQGYEVRCFDVPSNANRRTANEFRGRVETIWGDITRAEEVAKVVADRDAVIHLAAIIPSASETNPELARAVNVDGTRHIVRALQALARKRGKSGTAPLLIFPSSISVFGPSQHKKPPRRATEPVRATDNYTTHKIACEKMIRASKLPFVITRVGASIDPNLMGGDTEAMKLMFEMSPNNRVEYVHPGDVARAFVNALRCPAAVGKILLIGGGKSCQIRQRDLFEVLFSALGLEGIPAEAFGDRNYYTDWMDTRESQRLLKFQAYSWDDFRREVASSMSLYRWLLFPLRPIARQYLLSYSGPWQRRGT